MSLWDIVRDFDVGKLSEVLLGISKWEGISQANIKRVDCDQRLSEEALNGPLADILASARVVCNSAELSHSLARLGKETTWQLYIYGNADWTTLGAQFSVLRESIQTDLKERRFAFIQPSLARELETIRDGNEGEDSWFPVMNKMPEAKADVSDAVRCYAMEFYTASVFHSMRVAEHCLRALAKKLRIRLIDKKKSLPIEFATWEKIITNCHDLIKESRAMPHGPKRASKLEGYSQLVFQCGYIKDTWRNNISHTRKSYNEAEARDVLIRVKSFAKLTLLHLA